MALAALAGCSSSSELSSRLARIPSVSSAQYVAPPKSASSTNNPTARAAVEGATAFPVHASTGHEDTLPPAPVASSGPLAGNSPPNGWVSLESWSGTNHLSATRRAGTAGQLTYELRTAAGVVAVSAGSHLARLNGLSYWLGYAPLATNGELLVHALDAQKNILPLTRFSAAPGPTNPVIVIDAGHGGDNTGARSVSDGRFEKEFTLDWALRVRSLLEGRGWRVVLTRTNDVDLSLSDRVALADQQQAALFLSLHFNSGARPDQSGLETYCLTPAGLPSTLTRDYDDDVMRVYPNNAFDNQNLQYALRLHRTLLETTGAPDRGVRRARFMGVLRTQNRPAVLVEGGYLSNPQEAELIGRGEYRQKLAAAAASAILFTNEVPAATAAAFHAGP
jgi:N-acetylmuramoyl-L-alanine amidase